ncbi:protein phosphatase 2C domain-containing protein [Bacteriovoracaceae bacterium]|nr:protein phosphatase 2C domain-containing protein [Bacteriovoracaceae bacterium]
MQSKKNTDLFLKKVNDSQSGLIEIQDYSIAYFICKAEDKSKTINEDSLFVSSTKEKIRLGVADGAGGHPLGAEASFEICDELRAVSMDSCLKQIEVANERVRNLKVGARSTLAFGEIENDKIRFFTVGDSEILYWNSKGTEIYSSLPQSVAGYKVEIGLTTQSESLDEPLRNEVSTLVGDEFLNIISTTSFDLKKGHSLLIGTDGLFDNLSHCEIRDIIYAEKFLDSIEMLNEICLKKDPSRWKKDDDIAYLFLTKNY